MILVVHVYTFSLLRDLSRVAVIGVIHHHPHVYGRAGVHVAALAKYDILPGHLTALGQTLGQRHGSIRRLPGASAVRFGSGWASAGASICGDVEPLPDEG